MDTTVPGKEKFKTINVLLKLNPSAVNYDLICFVY